MDNLIQLKIRKSNQGAVGSREVLIKRVKFMDQVIILMNFLLTQ